MTAEIFFFIIWLVWYHFLIFRGANTQQNFVLLNKTWAKPTAAILSVLGLLIANWAGYFHVVTGYGGNLTVFTILFAISVASGVYYIVKKEYDKSLLQMISFGLLLCMGAYDNLLLLI